METSGHIRIHRDGSGLGIDRLPLWVPNPTLYLRDELAHRPEAVYHRSGAVHDRLDEAGADEGLPPAS